MGTSPVVDRSAISHSTTPLDLDVLLAPGNDGSDGDDEDSKVCTQTRYNYIICIDADNIRENHRHGTSKMVMRTRSLLRLRMVSHSTAEIPTMTRGMTSLILALRSLMRRM